MKKRMMFFLSSLVLVTLACNLSGSPTTGTPQGNNNHLVGTPPADPVSINDGLGSLNSYQMTVISRSIGPDPNQSSTITVETQHSGDLDATYTHFVISAVDLGDSEPSNTDSSLYRIGNDQCSGSDGDWSWTSMTPDQAEMLDIIKNMLGLTPLIDSPTFVGEETINGVSSNHFSFHVSGFGVQSGAEVTANQGDYWLAVDGQYIVKYTLILETSTDPQTNLLHEEISIELNQINQAINIAFPQACLDAQAVSTQ